MGLWKISLWELLMEGDNMMNDSSEKPGKKSGCLIALLVLSTILVISVFAVYIAIWRVPDNSKEAKKIREAAIEKIEKGNAIPKDENAWFVYYEAIEKFEKYRKANVQELKGGPSSIDSQGLTPENLAIMQKYIENNQEALELSRKAYNIKDFQIPRDYKQGPNEKSPDFLAVRSFTFFLTLSGDILAEKGKFKEAAEIYMQGLYLGIGAGQNNSLLGGMINLALESIVFKHLVVFINNNNLDANTCKYIIGEMSRLKKMCPPFTDYMDNELLMAHYSIDMVKSGKMGGQGQFKAIGHVKMFLDREERIYENQFLKDRKAVALKYKQACDALPENIDDVLPQFTILPKILYPNYKKAFQQDVIIRVEYDGIMLAAALKLYKIEKGKYPDSLSELVPGYIAEIPKDPYSPHEKFVYKKDGDNVKLYSIGPDLKDDGGKEEIPFVGIMDSGDLIFYNSSKKLRMKTRGTGKVEKK